MSWGLRPRGPEAEGADRGLRCRASRGSGGPPGPPNPHPQVSGGPTQTDRFLRGFRAPSRLRCPLSGAAVLFALGRALVSQPARSCSCGNIPCPSRVHAGCAPAHRASRGAIHRLPRFLHPGGAPVERVPAVRGGSASLRRWTLPIGRLCILATGDPLGPLLCARVGPRESCMWHCRSAGPGPVTCWMALGRSFVRASVSPLTVRVF